MPYPRCTVCIVKRDESPWWRALGGWAAFEGSNPERKRFDELTVMADALNVPWRDLIQDGYRVRGDLVAGGILVRYDWGWRADELERRLRQLVPPPAEA